MEEFLCIKTYGTIYGHIKHFAIEPNDQLYQIRPVDEPFNTYFQIMRSGELLTTISMNEENEWQAVPEIDEQKFEKILAYIKAEYGEK